MKSERVFRCNRCFRHDTQLCEPGDNPYTSCLCNDQHARMVDITEAYKAKLEARRNQREVRIAERLKQENEES